MWNWHQHLNTWALVILALGLAMSGCNLFEDGDRDVDLPLLLGSWRVTDLVVDGTSIKGQLDTQYERLVLTLRESASGSEFFSVIGRTEGAENDLFVQGSFIIDSDDDELTLSPEAAPTVQFIYSRLDSTHLRLQTDIGDEEEVLQLLRIRVQGDVDALHLDLRKDS